MNALDPATIASLKALDDGDGFFAGMVQAFLENAQPTLERLRQARLNNDVAELERAAHKLRGAASAVGARALAACCERLEQAARQGGAPSAASEAASEIDAIEAEFQRVVAALDAELRI
ncbi:MAG: hypothetical protein CFK52_08720 [Chloracidobacterium sp. CP2_5A]|nr:MAG: hypothetical protein CFK52_08720 [Chloracidobacterium sp. CP2_5A]